MKSRATLRWMAVAMLAGATTAGASSHREAPYITHMPKVDGTDLYMFRSYEPGREDFVTIIANYYPLQIPEAGPNYYMLDEEALYEIHVDNDGDAIEDHTFQFRFDNTLQSPVQGETGLVLPIGPSGSEKNIAVPLLNIGAITADDTSKLHVIETYSIKLVEGDRRSGTAQDITRTGGGDFVKPVDNIGNKSIPDYPAYANAHIYEIDIPGCTAPSSGNARVFVGQRQEGFYVNLGQLFDLVNVPNPVGEMDQTDPATMPFPADNVTEFKNVTTIALEIPASCLNDDADTVIGAWTTASVRQARVVNPSPTFDNPARNGGPWAQVSRLGMPLVNEVVIGLPDKNLFNAVKPTADAALIDYVHYPSLPELLEILFSSAGVQAPNVFPRTDLEAVFLTGVEGVNKTATASEMLRLNTGLPITAAGSQNNLGAALCFVDGVLDTNNTGCDPAGFPNGRRPGDDVVDITLRVAMGFLLPAGADAPSRDLPFTDGVLIDEDAFNPAFPYLMSPQRGSP